MERTPPYKESTVGHSSLEYNQRSLSNHRCPKIMKFSTPIAAALAILFVGVQAMPGSERSELLARQAGCCGDCACPCWVCGVFDCQDICST
ncbi:hypothetical protein BT69DRAFT_349454 [Atractiella rhizophila]|nr:hypothetical protein BT69DRAFT_349454 [Atractiella rhizophila]